MKAHLILTAGMALSLTTFLVADETKIVLDGSTTVGPIAKAFAEYYMENNKGVNITVSESGSGNGAKCLVNKTCDVADMSRFMKENEFSAAVANGVQPVAHVIALDGLAIIIHPSISVKGITLEQLQAVYLGKITNWKELGGPDMKIIKISRDTNSGTYETFETVVMKKGKIAKDVEYVGSNGAVKQRVSSTPGAIGYVGLGFVDKKVKALEVNGIFPSQKTIATGIYPIARPLYMFTDGYPKLGTHLYRFVTLYLTKKGQEIIESIGFIPMTDY